MAFSLIRPPAPAAGGNGGKLLVVTSHGWLRISILDMRLASLRQVIGPRVLLDLVRREVSRPCPICHPLTCKYCQATVQSRHWLSETLVATSTNDQHSQPRTPISSARGVGLRLFKDKFTQLALTVRGCYIGSIGYVALHAIEGINIITATLNGEAIVPRGKRKLVSFLAGIPTLTGLSFISGEAAWALTSSAESYVAASSGSVVYRIPL